MHAMLTNPTSLNQVLPHACGKTWHAVLPIAFN
jgi:hypothetical protein